MFIFDKTNKMEKERILTILRTEIFLAELFERENSTKNLKEILTYLNKQ